MITLPTQISNMKDSSEIFFVDLYVLHCLTGDLYFAALDEDVHWYIPGTTTPVTYIAMPIKRGSVTHSDDDKISNMDIQISNVTQEFSSQMFGSFDFRGTMVEILQIAYPGSLTSGQQFRYVFYGYLDNPSLDESKALFGATVVSVLPNMKPHRVFSLSCSAWFGDPEECGATKHTATGTASLSSTVDRIYVDGAGDLSQWLHGTVTIGFETKRIIATGGGYVDLEYPFFSSPAGQQFTAAQGCDHTLTTCKRYGNERNYNGFLGIPWLYTVKT